MIGQSTPRFELPARNPSPSGVRSVVTEPLPDQHVFEDDILITLRVVVIGRGTLEPNVVLLPLLLTGFIEGPAAGLRRHPF